MGRKGWKSEAETLAAEDERLKSVILDWAARRAERRDSQRENGRDMMQCCLRCGRDTKSKSGYCQWCSGRVYLNAQILEDDYSEESDADSVCEDPWGFSGWRAL